MIRSDKIQTLFGGVGFKQPTLTGYNIVDAANSGSTSGLYFGDVSELVTIKNIKDCQEDAAISNENFNKLLKSMQESVILDVCSKIISGQSDFICSLNLYPYAKSFKNTIEPLNHFVGFEIEPSLCGNIACSVAWIELCFNAAKTFNIYLYNTNKPNTHIQVKSVTTVANQATVVDLGWIIADDATYKGGKFYIGYFEDDLNGAKAYKKDYEFSNFSVNTPHYLVEPVYLSRQGAVLDINSELHSSDTFGLNIGMDVYTDYTELLLRNKSLLYPAIQLQMHERVLNMIRCTTRSNIQERILKDATLELYGNKELGIESVTDKLNRVVKHIQKSLFYVPRVGRSTAIL